MVFEEAQLVGSKKYLPTLTWNYKAGWIHVVCDKFTTECHRRNWDWSSCPCLPKKMPINNCPVLVSIFAFPWLSYCSSWGRAGNLVVWAPFAKYPRTCSPMHPLECESVWMLDNKHLSIEKSVCMYGSEVCCIKCSGAQVVWKALHKSQSVYQVDCNKLSKCDWKQSFILFFLNRYMWHQHKQDFLFLMQEWITCSRRTLE